jgi:SET domain
MVENTIMPSTKLDGIAEIRIDVHTGVRSLFAKQSFEENEVISNFTWLEEFKTPTYLTVQIKEEVHIELQPKFLECINHSCAPNAFFDTTKKQLVCIQTIKIGEEITFFYPSAEWNMDKPFECNCGSKACIGFVRGALHLKENELIHYRFTDFIQQKIKQ